MEKTKTSENPYALSDRSSKLLNRKAIRRFDKAKKDCNLLHFDELNVIKVLTALYKALAADNKQAFLDLAILAYQDAQPHGKKEPDKSWLLALLDSYDPVALYVYAHEVDRKRDYAIESVVASKGKAKEFRRALKYWARMTGHMTDRITDEATLKAYQDAGVKFVKWNSEHDSKVCEKCDARDGKIYPIDKAPPKEHLNCRCYYTAATEK